MSTSSETMVFDGDSSRYVAAMNKAEDANRKYTASFRPMSAEARNAYQEMSRAQEHNIQVSTRSKMAMQQLSYMVGDAASTWGNLQSVVRGVGNNAEMFAMTLGGPVAGAVTAVGVAMIPTVSAMMGFSKETKKTVDWMELEKESLKEANESWDSYEQRIQKAMLTKQQFADWESKQDLKKKNRPHIAKMNVALRESAEQQAEIDRLEKAKAAIGDAPDEASAIERFRIDEALKDARGKKLLADNRAKQAAARMEQNEIDERRARQLEQNRETVDDIEKGFGANLNMFAPGGLDFKNEDWKHKDKFAAPDALKRRVNRARHDATAAERAEEDAKIKAKADDSPGGKHITKDEQRGIDALHAETVRTNRLLQDLVTFSKLAAEQDVARAIGEALASLGPAGAILGQQMMPQRQRAAQR